MTTILGLNAYHADSAACLVRDGELVAAAEEERFRRIKHWAGLPSEAVRYCLAEAGLSLDRIDHVAINRNPRANLFKKVLFAFAKRPSLDLVRARLENAGKVANPIDLLAAELGVERAAASARLHPVEHHRAHLASAFYVSPFERAAVVSIDGFGDFASAMWATGRGGAMTELGKVHFPHSLGLLYQAVTQYLGFWNYGDEYKVMGLAPYGQPNHLEALRRLVSSQKNGGYELTLDYFRHHAEGVEMVWDGGQPRVGRIFTAKLEELLGPARGDGEDLSRRHKDIAASLQALYEETFFDLLNAVQATTGDTVLCLAGGCAMNSVANGKIFEQTPFTELYVQAAAGDAGGAIGAAYSVWHDTLGQPRGFVMDHAFLGPEWTDDALGAEIEARRAAFEAEGCAITHVADEAELCRRTAAAVADGHVVGWFQGRMEWGPRALGNRSIVCDPRRADMKDILNAKIKRRESFRPFAPSIMREHVGEWFETDYEAPFMLQVYQIREDRRAAIPAVTHVNGSGRLQTVTAGQNPRYHRLIDAFRAETGVPMVLNTSFNENEPVVCRPGEAIECFLRTRMDLLVLGNWMVCRT
ncbi:MAG: carbamoyltransferase [Proteobacteria bacterium]|nr:carbamoyltransferase [Pseudomonadota bacterium]